MEAFISDSKAAIKRFVIDKVGGIDYCKHNLMGKIVEGAKRVGGVATLATVLAGCAQHATVPLRPHVSPEVTAPSSGQIFQVPEGTGLATQGIVYVCASSAVSVTEATPKGDETMVVIDRNPQEVGIVITDENTKNVSSGKGPLTCVEGSSNAAVQAVEAQYPGRRPQITKVKEQFNEFQQLENTPTPASI